MDRLKALRPTRERLTTPAGVAVLAAVLLLVIVVGLLVSRDPEQKLAAPNTPVTVPLPSGAQNRGDGTPAPAPPTGLKNTEGASDAP